MVSTDGSEDVSDFLRRIKEHGDDQELEDRANDKKLEDEILEARKLREARRAERARSISPDKRSQASTPQSMRSVRSKIRADVTNSPLSSAFSPPAPTSLSSVLAQERETPQSITGTAEMRTHDIVEPSKPKSIPRSPSPEVTKSASALSRAPTLSWQQRPSAGSVRGQRSRPLSLVGRTETSPVRQPVSDRLTDNGEDAQLSREQIAKNLAAKDPAWFQQTAERGTGSAAYKQQQEGEEDSLAGQTVEKRQLHGLSEISRSNSPSITEENGFSFSRSQRSLSPPMQSDASFTVRPLMTSPDPEVLPLTRTSKLISHNPAKQPEITNEPSFEVATPSRSASRRISPERRDRATSPTKGMGGFVQSAMLRRSESVNKRWTVQAAPVLSKVESQTSPHSNMILASGLPASTSSLNLANSTATESTFRVPTTPNGDVFAKQMPQPAESPAATDTEPGSKTGPEISDPVSSARDDGTASPIKRYSPVKSSWLENALNKPETQKLEGKITQPSWMMDLNKKKQQQGTTAPADPLGGTRSGKEFLERSGYTRSVERADMGISKEKFHADVVTAQRTPRSRLGAEKSTQAPTIGENGESRASNETPTEPQMFNNSSERPSSPSKDLRSALHTRTTSTASSTDKNGGDAPEFLSAFGKLKRTQTQNYKAPDTFKENILRGKGALNNTGGPKKTERVDEFKESILKKKEAMNANPIVATELKSKAKDRVASPPPEAIIQKSALSTTTKVAPRSNPSLPEAIAKKNALASTGPGMSVKVPPAKPKPLSERQSKHVMVDRPATQSLGEAPNSAPETAFGASSSAAAGVTESAEPGNKLGTNFNQGLASILARGPPTQTRERTGPTNNETQTSAATTSSKSSGQLEHMTKGRARGPKRRLPKTIGETTTSIPEDSPPEISDQQRTTSTAPISNAPASTPRSSKIVSDSVSEEFANSPNPYRSPGHVENVSTLQGKSSSVSLKGHEDQLDSRHSSFTPGQENKARLPEAIAVADPPQNLSVKKMSSQWRRQSQEPPGGNTPKIRPLGEVSRQEKEPLAIHVGATSARRRDQPSSQPSTPDKRTLEMRGTPENTTPGTKQAPAKPAPLQSKNTSRSVGSTPTRPPMKPDLLRGLDTTKQGKTIPETLSAFFNVLPRPNFQSDRNTQALVDEGRLANDRIKTLRKQIHQMTGDGKMLAMPANQEHVLFSDSMYICTHVFGDTLGAKVTEIYLWVGSNVFESALEDAQLFAKRAAKDNSGKLLVFRQGKEPASFFQALGGIVIIRRRSTQSASQSYVLCGRKHMGHIAFDEVQYAMSSFCSGYPYVVASISGTMYLWKGLGCTADELGCARLISMDLGPTGQVEEVDEGKETEAFLGLFSDRAMPSSSQHWPLKPKHSNFQTRLFRVEHSSTKRPSSRPGSSTGLTTAATATASVKELWSYMRRPSQADIQPRPSSPSTSSSSSSDISEIQPYTQTDLEPDNIYVLDTFFEIFVLCGPLTSAYPTTFAKAIHFAQDYAILAASAQDRPFVPQGSVVLQSGPEDMKGDAVPREVRMAFRGWDAGYVPTGALMAGKNTHKAKPGFGAENGSGSGLGLRVLKLDEVAAALREGGTNA